MMESTHTLLLSTLILCSCFLRSTICNTTVQTETSSQPVTVESKVESIDKNQNEYTSFQIDRVAAQESYFFIKRIFQHYGDGEKMTLDNLNSFFETLGLASVEESPDHVHRREAPNHSAQRGSKTNSPTSTSTFLVDTSRYIPNNDTDHIHFHDQHTQCLHPQKLLEAFHFPENEDLTIQHFFYISPALLFQSAFCEKEKSSHDHRNLESIKSVPYDKTKHVHVHMDQDHHDHNESDVAKHKIDHTSTSKVWGYSTIAVIIISLVGLLGVAVIPVMQRVFYNHLLQFLVALAVGALSGDALLHLLPHAMNEHDHAQGSNEKEDHAVVYKGLLGLSGMFLFFFVERLLTIFTDYKRKRRQKKKDKEKCNKDKLLPKAESKSEAVGARLSDDPGHTSCEEMMMVVHSSKVIKNYAADTRTDLRAIEECTENNHADVATDEEATLNHSHHGHSHSVPNSVAAVAWMVILGDGIHNFSDGLAIGAAFANSIPGGFSTSVAVFCHELPHEIGDFAVLLRAGMSVKQAIVYNCISSILCFIGMLIGVALGNIAHVSLWIFVIVAGMFLYIALVDMLPEIMSVSPKKGENQFAHLLIQCSGMLIGAGIMLTIALHERSLLSVLG